MPNTSDHNDAIMQKIHDDANMELVDKLANTLKQVIEKEGKLKNSTVSATLAYMLADSIAQRSTHDEICSLSQSYAEYIHRCAHGLKMVEDDDPELDQSTVPDNVRKSH